MNARQLIIDGKPVGEVTGYRQNREIKRWVFLMRAGYYISIDWSNIKSFSSGGENLEIITYQH